MNWTAWSSIVDNTIYAIIAIGILITIEYALSKHDGDNQECEDTDSNNDIFSAGDHVEFNINDSEVIEAIRIIEEKQDILWEQIEVQHMIIEQAEDELEQVLNALDIGSLHSSYTKLGRQRVQLEKKIADAKMRIYTLGEKSDKLHKEWKNMIINYGTVVSVTKK